MGTVHYLYGDPWLSKRQLANQLGRSISYVEKRTRDGMPSRMLGGRRQYRQQACEAWLAENGHLVEDSTA